jgi:glycosyltransferase involved in cell wall biosynthesis
MHVLVFSYEIPPLGGGVGTAISHLIDEWLDRDMRITLITSSLENRFSQEHPHENYTIQYVPVGRSKHNSLSQQRILDQAVYAMCGLLAGLWHFWKHRPDRALSFGYPGPLVTSLLSWFGLPFIHALRGVDVPGYNPRFAWGSRIHSALSRVMWNRAERLTANSTWLKSLAEEVGADTTITVIPNGVDLERFQPVPESNKFERFTVTAGGTLFNEKKQLHLLVEGFAQFVEELSLTESEAQLLLIGSGAEERRLRHLVKQLGIEAHTTFAGTRDPHWIAAHLPRCHVFCLPSLAEGMSNAALEALACGLPLILSDVGAAQEMVEGNGVILQHPDARQISETLRSWYQDVSVRQHMGDRSAIIAKQYEWRQIAQSYQETVKTSKQV